MRSLSNRLIVGTTLVTGAILAAAGVLLFVLMRASLMSQFDRSLREKAQSLASALEQEHGELEVDFEDFDMSEFQGTPPAAYLYVWNADTSLVYQSSTSSVLDSAAPLSDAPRFQTLRLPDGRAGRAVTLTFHPRFEHKEEHEDDDPEHSVRGAVAGREPVTILLARPTAPVDSALARLRLILVSVGVVAVTLSAALLLLVVRRSLQPLERLARDIASVREEHLGATTIELQQPVEEIAPVVEKLNELLGRVSAAVERERLFSANVAHELRNPLAGLRLKMDVALSRARQASDYARALDECQTIVGQMHRMVENLLSLTRLEAGLVPLQPTSVSLGTALRSAWEETQAVATAKGLDTHWSIPEECVVQTDPSLLHVILHNVFENAVDYANANGEVRIEAKSSNGLIEIAVANSGSQLTQSEAERCFEHFWRGDTARTDTGTHCGLGLSLVQKATTALGGQTCVRSTSGGTFTIMMSFPKPPAA